jgi:hypothetical protein
VRNLSKAIDDLDGIAYYHDAMGDVYLRKKELAKSERPFDAGI